MTTRTVTVKLRAEIASYLAGMKMSEKATKQLRDETDRLNKAGSTMLKTGGITAALAGVPGVATAAASSIALVPAAAFSATAALGTLAVATNGVGDAMSAVADGDSKKLAEALAGLTHDAQVFVREYARVKPMLDQLGDSTQSALFREITGDLELLTRQYLPTLLTQMPRVASATGQIGHDFATWAVAPNTVAKVSGQFDLAVDLLDDFSRMLRSGTALLLDLADAGKGFTAGTVGGLADGVEALERWVRQARATGQIDALLASAARVMERLGQVTADTGEILFDVLANPALADGAVALLDVLGLTLEVVRALLTVFEALPSGVQSAVVTFGVLGGAALILTSRIVALQGALNRAKVSAVQAGTTLRSVAGVFGGPWGAALTVATVALGIYATKQAEAESRADEFRATLDVQTGAITDNTRSLVANNLEQKGFLALGAKYGIAGDEMVNAILAGGDALDQLRDKVTGLAKLDNPDFDQLAHLKAYLGESSKEAQGFVAAQQRVSGAVGTTTGKVEEQISALQTLAIELRKQSDPAFALIKAQQDMAKAQEDYNDAVEEYGKNSPQARAASVKLAEQAVIMAEAVGGAADTFDGKLTPALRATLEAANLSERQIQDIEDAFAAARVQGDKFAKRYEAKVTAETKKADAALLALIRQLEKIKNKTISVQANVYYNDQGLHVGTGTQTRRWGGIDYAMARGGSIEAHHATSPTVLYGERATGGEAFIPRNGDYARSMSILSKAAGWYGASVMPAMSSGGGGGGGPVALELTLVMRSPTGRETRQVLRAEAVGRGVPTATIAVAYP